MAMNEGSQLAVETTPEAGQAASPRRAPSTFSRGRRFLSFLNLAAIVFLSFYILVVAGIIVYFHPTRIDLTVEGLHTLSEGTHKRLELVDREIRVVIPFLFQDRTALSRIQREIFTRARTLLDQYVHAQPLIRIESELNLMSLSDSLTWQELQKRYDLPPEGINRFIFLAGEEGEFRQTVTLDELALYDRPTNPYEPVPPKIHKFLGEEAFSSALTRLIRREQKRILFTTGSHELSLEETSGAGLSFLRDELVANGYEVGTHDLEADGAVPTGCDVLVMVNPRRELGAEAAAHLQQYLVDEGRALVTLGPLRSGVESVLAEWGVKVFEGIARQKVVVGQRADWSREVVLARRNPLHPITRDFQDDLFEVHAAYLRPLAAPGKDAFSGEFLFRSAPQVTTIIDANLNRRLDSGEEEGAVVGGVSISKPTPPRPPPGYVPQNTRLVVLGDSSIVANAGFNKYSHRELSLNIFRWLAGLEEELVAQEGEPWKERMIKWSPRIHRFLFWVPIIVFPGVILCAGLFVYFLRRT